MWSPAPSAPSARGCGPVGWPVAVEPAIGEPGIAPDDHLPVGDPGGRRIRRGLQVELHDRPPGLGICDPDQRTVSRKGTSLSTWTSWRAPQDAARR